MGLFDRSSSSTTNQENTLNQPIQTSDQGISIAGTGGSVTVLQTDQNAFDDATKLARDSIAAVSDSAKGAQEVALQSGEQLNTAISDIASKAFSFVQGATEAQQKSLGETVSSLNAISVEQNKSTDQRVAEIAAGAQKNILYIVLALGAAVIAYAYLKKGHA